MCEGNLPIISGGRHRDEAGGIGVVTNVTGRIALVRNVLLLAGVDVVVREREALELIGRLDDGGGQTHLDVPLDVAVEEPDARVVGLEAQDGEAAGVDRDRVALGRLAVVVGVALGPLAGSGLGPVEHLEVVAVQMERVVGTVQVVDDDLDHLVALDDEGVDLAVDLGVLVVVARGGGAVQGGHRLLDVRLVVEAGARVVVLVAAESKVKLDQGVIRIQDGTVVVRLEVRVIGGRPLLHNVGLVGGLAGVHDKIAGVVERELRRRGLVGEITVDVQSDQEGVVAVVPIDALDQEIVPLRSSNVQLVRLLLLNVGTIVHDDIHVMRIKVDQGRRKRREVNHANAVSPALGEVDSRSRSLVNNEVVRNRRPEVSVGRLQHVADKANRLRVVPAC